MAVNRLCNIADDVYRKRIEDISLDEKQKKSIEVKLKKIKDEGKIEKIRNSLNTMAINATNYDATIRRIESLIEGE